MDEDGIPDLISLTTYGIDVRLGRGDGIFGTARSFLTLADEAPVRLEDLDVDGHLGPARSLPFHSASPATPQPIAIASLDPNAAPDLIFGMSWGIAVELNPGTTAHDSAGRYPANAVNAVATGDFDEDGTQDVVGATWSGWDLLRGNGDGSLQPAVTIGEGGTTLFAGDFDLDGHLDVMCSGVLYEGAGNGTFEVVDSLRFDPAAVADLDGDGRADVIRLGASSVEVRFGDGPFSFGPPETWTTGLAPFDLAMGDVNGDA